MRNTGVCFIIFEANPFFMRKHFYLFGLAFTLGISARAQFTVTRIDNGTLELDFNITNMSLGSGTTLHLQDPNATPILEKGSPDLLKYSFTMQLPSSGTPVVTVDEGDIIAFEDVNILPSKGSLKRNVNPADVPLEYGDVYNQDAFWPTQRAVVNQPFIFRNARGASVHVFPYAYNPVTKILRVYKKMHISIAINQTKSGMNVLAEQHADAPMQAVYENLFINYSKPAMGTRYTPMEENGEMLIISSPACTTAMQPLIDWKIQRGIKTEMVTTSTTGSTQSAIKSYISTYYSTHPNLTFVLLVGDHEQIPAYNAGSTGWETKWSDSYYGFITGSDKYPEVFMGRLPAKNATHASSMVSKIVEYEKTPSAGTWYTTSIGIGSDEGAGIGDDGEADWQHMRNIRTELMNFGYTTVHEFYDGSHGGTDAAGNPNSTMVANAVEDGASLFMYCGHGSLGTCVTSNYSISNIQAATNYGKYPFVISVACNNGTFPGGECLTEEFMRASNTGGPTGAIGACGSSILMAWAEPMETEDEISKILSQLYSGNIKYTLGGLFYNGQMKMLEKYPSVTGEEVMETWVMFGDPSVMIRSKTPQTMSVSHALCYNNEGTFVVTGGIEGADVAITQDGQILGSGTISGGTASINITGATTTNAILTVTGYNQLPYTTTLTPCALGIEAVTGNNISIYPNPATDVLYIEGGNVYTYVLTDASGKTIAQGIYANSIDISNLSNGLYLVQVKDLNGGTHVSRFVKK